MATSMAGGRAKVKKPTINYRELGQYLVNLRGDLLLSFTTSLQTLHAWARISTSHTLDSYSVFHESQMYRQASTRRHSHINAASPSHAHSASYGATLSGE